MAGPLSDDLNKRGKRLKTGHKINLLHVIVGFLLLIVTAIGVFKDEIFGPSAARCKTLKLAEQSTIEKINNLVKGRQSCVDKDSIEYYYDFEIKYANAELQNIQESLKICTD